MQALISCCTTTFSEVWVFWGAVRLGVAFWSEDGDFEKQLKSKFVSDRICLSFVEQSDLELPFGQKMAILKAAEVPPLTPTPCSLTHKRTHVRSARLTCT